MTRSLPLGLGEVRLTKDQEDQLCVFGLGSCVAVFLYAPGASAVAAAHVVLPKSPGTGDAGTVEPGRYADQAVPLLVAEMAKAGVLRSTVRAAIAGGAAVLGFTSAIGEQNIQAVRRELELQHIQVEQEDVGGTRGRSVLFNAIERRLEVRVLSAPNFNI